MWPGEPREKEAVNAISHGTGQDFGKRPGVSTIRSSECVQVPRSVSLVDHSRRIPMPDEKEVRREPADSSVPVAERMNPLEASVEIGDEEHRVLVISRPLLDIS